MLKQRIVTAVLGLIVIFAALLAGGLAWRVFVWVSTLIALVEFSNMLKVHWKHLLIWWGGAIVTITQWVPTWHTLIALQLGVGITVLMPVVSRNRSTITQSAAVFLGALYIGYGGWGLAHMRALSDGTGWLLMFLMSIWMTDTAAFFVGSRVKGPKLWPAISPGKTISGAVGGLVGGTLGALLVAMFLLPGQPFGRIVGIGLVTSIAGQLGDLVESAYKRSAGVKDSGSLLPGHGGMLDRVDSLLFAAPFTYFLILIGFPKGWL